MYQFILSDFMIKLFLNKFFSAFNTANEDDLLTKLNKYTSNELLLEELFLCKKFKNTWRKTIGSDIVNEKYKITKVAIETENNIFKISLELKHSFNILQSNTIYNSKELKKYIIILKKETHKYYILDLINEEYYPTFYNKLINSKNINVNSSIFLLRDTLKIQFWKDKFNLLDKITNSYFDLIKAPLKRTIVKIKYDRKKACDYAIKYALSYNEDYTNYNEMGGDCTNFISQCVCAGNIPLTKNWRPYTNSWIRVNDLYSYLINNKIGININVNDKYQSGDIIQFYSNTKGFYSHSCIITKVLTNGDYLYCCHSYDKLNFPLSEIYPIIFNKYRVIHISN